MVPLRWHVSRADSAKALEIGNRLGVSPIIGQMLVNRKITDAADAHHFLNPSLGQLFDPFLMPGMEKAVDRIAKAIKEKQNIVVFGDYDVDGVTGTTSMYHALKFWGAEPRLYIPHRINEGYGIQPETMSRLIDEGAELVISVDCGITAVEPAQIAKSRGIDFIVTDHHDWKDVLPDTYATVHPRLRRADGGVYPNPMICGSGVAFKVAWALNKAMTGESKAGPEYKALLGELLAFAALGTIADVVPLVGENRIIATFGLRKLPESRFEGVKALLASAHLGGQDVDGYHVGFCLAPRLNAAGRMGHASTALEMFTKATWEEAVITAKDLERQNKERQATERDIVQSAKAQAVAFEDRNALVLVGADWHSGVVGIVASRVIDDYYRPCIILSQTGDELHGSARSIEGFNLAKGLKACEDLFIRWGGHGAAAGLKMKAEHLEEFRRRLHDYVTDNCPAELLKRRLDIDAWCTLEDINMDLVCDIKRMGPFGISNRRPVLALQNAIIENPKTMGKEGKHLVFNVAQGSFRMKCKMWNAGDLAHKLPTDKWVNIAVEPEINHWNGRDSVELLCRDVQVAV
jgi:single-stranded-DNA-specific exonuclease